MQKITLEKIKEHCKGYTEAYGYYSCRKTDFDWLIKQAELVEKLFDDLEKAESRPVNACIGCGNPIDHNYCTECRRL